MALVNDSFDNLDQWTNGDSGGTSSIESGKLKQTGSGPPNKVASVVSNEALSGEFDISIDWDMTPVPTVSGYGVFFSLQNVGGTPQTYVSKRLAGIQAYTPYNDSRGWLNTGVPPGRFRIIRKIDSGVSTYHLYRGRSGWGWTKVHSHTMSNTDDVYIRLYLQTDNYSYPLTAYWDNLTIASTVGSTELDDDFTDLDKWGSSPPEYGYLEDGKLKLLMSGSSYSIAESANWLVGEYTFEIDYNVELVDTSSDWQVVIGPYTLGHSAPLVYQCNIKDATVCGLTRTSDTGTIRFSRTNSEYFGYVDHTIHVKQGAGAFVLVDTITNSETGDNLPLRLQPIPAYGFTGDVIVSFDNLTFGEAVVASNDLYCPDSEVDFIGPAATAGKGFGVPDCADIPDFFALTEWNTLACWDTADVPNFFAASDPVARLLAPDCVDVPRFFATTGRVASFRVPDSTSIPRFRGSTGKAASFSAPDCADVPRHYALVNGFATIILPDSEVIPIFSVWGPRYVVVMNALHHGVTEYENFPFESLEEFEGRYYGLTGSGWYILGGDTDDGAEIAASFATGDMNYNNGEEMRLLDAKLTARSTEQVKLTVAYDDETGYDYYEGGDPSGEVKSIRFVPGKGAKGRAVRLTIENTNGGSLEAKQLVMTVADLSRGGR